MIFIYWIGTARFLSVIVDLEKGLRAKISRCNPYPAINPLADLLRSAFIFKENSLSIVPTLCDMLWKTILLSFA